MDKSSSHSPPETNSFTNIIFSQIYNTSTIDIIQQKDKRGLSNININKIAPKPKDTRAS